MKIEIHFTKEELKGLKKLEDIFGDKSHSNHESIKESNAYVYSEDMSKGEISLYAQSWFTTKVMNIICKREVYIKQLVLATKMFASTLEVFSREAVSIGNEIKDLVKPYREKASKKYYKHTR